MKRVMSVALSTALLSAGAVAVSATPAAAGAACDSSPIYSIGDKKTVWRATNVHSDWAKPGVTISYAKNKTGSWTATGTATVGTEAGAIFAKASASFSVSVGKTWSKSDTWTYAATVQKKKGKSRGRLMMYHEAKGFSVTKYRMEPKFGGGCKKVKLWKKSGNIAPVKRNNNLWGIQYA
ncbi:hypothetical protein GTY75_12960 [Streptomyces sp. SID8381]|nr:hypothetical protein SSTG_05653 [Streptomyces sp. e14]MYS45077.1 hypothetical protein [Streptomyces sp. SID5998]MYX27548.1 hypothetical protein [Streptomyces sp. SID8381]MYX42233.1 hypothetical protein [Streptomyces sp. SID89]NED37149.1 hypothetical protein [Streptomyces sp. SID8499]NED71754.1 hypothetical protein [Streptomyces sp. SID9944]NMO34983.1 hypothetical protein [Streptomyces sp. GMY02]